MSYPTDSSGAMDAGGAFEIGSNWGQDLTESSVKALYTPTSPTMDGALDEFAGQLGGLPLDTLKAFQPLISGATDSDFADTSSAIAKIMSSLNNEPTFLNSAKWNDWLGSVWDDLVTMFNQVCDIFNGLIVTPFNTVVNGILEWFLGLLGWRQATDNNQTNTQNFQITQLTTTAYANPRWVCKYPIGDVIFPEANLMSMGIFGASGPASTGTAHTHSVGTLEAAGPGAHILKDESIGAIMSMSNTAAIDTVEVFASTRAGTPTSVHLEVFRVYTDGSAAKVTTADITAQLTGSYKRISVTLPTTLIAQAGEKYLIRVRNSSSSACTVGVVSLEGDYNFLEDISWSTTNFTDTSKVNYTAAEMTTMLSNTYYTMWACMASANPTLTDVSFSDDFNRAAFGGLWSLKSNVADQLSVWANQATYTAAMNGHQDGLYVWRTTREGNKVEGQITTNVFANSNQRVGLTMHCNRDFSQQVFLGVGKTAVNIYSGSSDSLTSRATISRTGNDGLWTLYYDVPNNQYVALLKGDPVGLSWTDSSNLVSHGAEFRFGGVRIECNDLAAGGQIDNWTLRDFTAPV